MRASDVLDWIGEAIVVLDRNWRVTYWNAAAERASGVPRAEIVGRRLWDRFPILRGTPFERAMRESVERRRGREFHGWHYPGTPDGRGAGIYDARSYPLDDGGVLLLFTDVTGREKQRRELEARIRENESLRDFARQMAAVSDTSALLRLLCEAALAELGGVASLVVRSLDGGRAECLAAAGAAVALQGRSFPTDGSLIERVLKSRSAVVLEAYQSESPFFQKVAADTNLGPIVMTPLVAHGECLGVLGLARRTGTSPFTLADLGRLAVIVDHASLAAWKARLLEEAEGANEAKANFLATMSHELRTPLTALTGYGELLSDEIMGPLSRQQHDIVERMRAVTHHLSAMIDELLTYSSLEAGREHARVAEIPVREIVEDAVAVIEPLAHQKGLTFTVDPLAGLPTLRTDGDKVRQILVNLLGNGVKFTDKGGVHLSFVVDERTVRFAVQDTGIGIPKALQERLFQPFFQLDTGLTRRHGGTGLGLYISRRLAELLGGRIELVSAEGKGAAFTLVLPR